jgi:hypothetical protein
MVNIVGADPPNRAVRVARTYADLPPGELGLIKDSWNQAALALNGASAAELLGVRRGDIVRLSAVDPAGSAEAGEPAPDSGSADATGPAGGHR